MRRRGRLAVQRIRDENNSEDGRAVEQEERLLAGCKVHLSSVFVHWEPVFQLSEPQSAQPGNKLDSSHLACDIAHLLTKWSLRWLVEDAYDETRTKEFLTWFEMAVIKHREIVDVLMLDSGLKADLLQLYHDTFEAQPHAGFSARMKTCHLFTNNMLRLVEMQGQLSELHAAVVSACMADPDQSRHGKSPRVYSQTVRNLKGELKRYCLVKFSEKP